MTGTELRSADRNRRRWLLGLAGLAILIGVFAWRQRSPDPDALVERADSLETTDAAAAERLLREAITISHGQHAAAEAALCELLARQGDWNEALTLFRRLEAGKCPDERLVEFGRRAYEAGHVDDAVAALSEVRGRRSVASIAALDVLFQVFRDRGDDSQMLECVRDMAVLQNNSPELWWKLIELLDSRGMTTAAIEALRQALERPLPARDLSEMRHQLVARLVDQGASEEARAELQVLATRETGSPRVRLHEAAINRLEGKPGQALEAIQGVFAAGKPSPGMLHLRALIYLDLKKFQAAVDDLKAETLAKPFDLVAHYQLAAAYEALGEAELARRHQEICDGIRGKRQRINHLREHWGQHPQDREACIDLARLCRELDDREEAERWEKRAGQPVSAPAEPE